ncbi:MAG: kelch repeat-containing protein [Chloroflexota bacterium]
MSRVILAFLIGFLALFAAAAGWASHSQAQEEEQPPLLVVDPPSNWLERVVSIDDLEPVPGDPRTIEAAAGADTCVDATGLTLSFFSTADGSATLTNPYTEQESDPRLMCMWGTPNNQRGYRTIWYRYVATDTGQVTITTRGTNYDTVLAVYTGGCESLLSIACSDDYLSLQSQVSFQAVRNQTYYIEVADWQAAVSPQAILAFSAVMNGKETQWEQVGNIPFGGISRHAVAQQGSEIYLIGGQQNLTAFPTISNQVQRYHADTGQWSILASMPGSGYSNTTAVQIGGKVYVPGGFNGNTTAYDGTHWVYDIATDFWSTAPSIPANLLPDGLTFAWSEAVADPSGQSYYLVGGLASQPAIDPDAIVVDETYKFTPGTGQWQALTPMTTARYAHTAAWVSRGNRGLCVAGGLTPGMDADGNAVTILLTDAECYNPNTGSGWVATAPLNFPRYNAASAIGPDGNWYIFGGLDVSGAVAETEVYDLIANSWKLLDSSYSLGGRPNDPARAWPVGAFVGNNLWVFGGNDYPERRVISSFKRINVAPNQVPLFNRLLIPFTTAGGGANFLNSASPLALNAPATGRFTESDQFYNAYYFDWFEFGRASVRLTNIPSDSNFNVLVYDSQKRLRGQGDVLFGGEKWVDVTLEPGRYYVLVERLFPKDLPDPNDYYNLLLTK